MNTYQEESSTDKGIAVIDTMVEPQAPLQGSDSGIIPGCSDAYAEIGD